MSETFDFVEARMMGVSLMNDKNELRISFRGHEAKRFVLLAEGVDRCVVTDFREQNIVDRVHRWDSTSELGRYRESLVMLITGANTESADPAWQASISKEISAIQAGQKVFVEIEPVYGAAVAILARSATVVVDLPSTHASLATP